MKKIISLISAVAMMAGMAVSVHAATEPTLSLEVSSTGLSAGDTVTVVCKYDGYNVTPYDDGEGSGQKATGAQIRINIPGGIGAPSAGKQFVRAGVTNTPGFSTGAPQYNWDMTNNQFTFASSGIDDPMGPSGTAFTITMKLNKDVTEDLVFSFADGYNQQIVYDDYEEWSMGATHQDNVTNLVSATLAGPSTPDDPEPTVDWVDATQVGGVFTSDTYAEPDEAVAYYVTLDLAQADPTITWRAKFDGSADFSGKQVASGIADKSSGEVKFGMVIGGMKNKTISNVGAIWGAQGE